MTPEIERPIDDARRALEAIHERLWDPEAELVRVAPGVTPSHNLSALNLHAVRETALGAVLDLRRGQVTRATAAIRRVLAEQYVEEGVPWSGTFKVCAEEASPSAGAVEWLHYDPNWRQFIGCILAFTLERHAADLRSQLVAEMEEAIVRCVRGEPAGRIPDWYTNPNLMHAWLTSWLGVRTNDARFVADGETRLQKIMTRFERYGDVDEYNSPTYDGIDLFAVALWLSFPPTPRFERAGTDLATAIGSRLGRLYHPALGAICGPYIRAYGVSLDRYVSLAGQWLALAGADASRVLPSQLDEHTIHVHDLYFLELFDELAQAVVPHVEIQAVDVPRDHEQRFGAVVAASHLERTCAMGAERGRVATFATDQYMPFTVHYVDGAAVSSVGVRLGAATTSVDAFLQVDRAATVTANGAGGAVELILVMSAEPVVQGTEIVLGRLHLEFSVAPSRVTVQTTPTATELRVAWDADDVTMTARLRPIASHQHAEPPGDIKR